MDNPGRRNQRLLIGGLFVAVVILAVLQVVVFDYFSENDGSFNGITLSILSMYCCKTEGEDEKYKI